MSLALRDQDSTLTDLEPPLPLPVANDALVVIHSRQKCLQGERYVLGAGPMRVGRLPDNEVGLDDVAVSRRHARLEKRAGGWVLMDVGSRNGTFCNDREISGEVTLQSGDRVKIGSTIFKYLSGEDAEAQFFEEICRLRVTDSLTQVHSRQYFDDELEREFWRVRRHHRSLCLVVFDIDRFKGVNDEHGHLAGDAALRDVASLVAGRVRKSDTVARYGGDEFCVLMPETALADAVALAQELCSRVAGHAFVFRDDRFGATSSFGVAELTVYDASPNELFQRADEALFDAKRAGGNRVKG
jgi:two-component system, cell cycle response regulator